MSNTTKHKRYNLVMPEALYLAIESIANEWDTTILEVIKRFIKIGLAIYAIHKSPDTTIMIRENGEVKEIRWFL